MTPEKAFIEGMAKSLLCSSQPHLPEHIAWKYATETIRERWRNRVIRGIAAGKQAIKELETDQ